jgi:hypothetical protein
MQFPAEPTFGIALGIVCLLVRSYFATLVARKPGPHVTTPFFGFPQARVLGGAFGIFFALNVPTAVLFFILREIPGYNAQELACFMQSGSQLGPGSYIVIILIVWMLIVISMMNRRVTVRHDVAQRFDDMGCLGRATTRSNLSKQSDEEARAEAPAGRPRIAFFPSHAGCWVSPFAKRFAANCQEAPFDVVCLDSYGHKNCDFKDDQWLRCNLALEDSDYRGEATLKVILTDTFTLDIPTNSVDVFVIPTGPNMLFLQLECKTEEERVARLGQILTEVNRVLRPGGRLVSSSMSWHYALWDKAVALSGLSVPAQPEEPVPTWFKKIPFWLRKIVESTRPNPNDPEGHGTGRRGWLPTAVWWTVVPARLHWAAGSGGADGDVIPSLEGEKGRGGGGEEKEGEIATNPPIIFQGSSLADAEETSFFPPGLQFRLVEALVVFNVLCWVALVVALYINLVPLQVPVIMPYSRQVASFVMEVVLLTPPLIIFNADALREAAKTNGLVVPFAVLRNKILRTYGMQRLYFLGVVLFSLLFWIPYLILDYCLIVYGGKSQDDAQRYNFIIGLTISLFFVFGGGRVAAWAAKRLAAKKEADDKAEEEDIIRERSSASSIVELPKPSGDVTRNPLTSPAGRL